ncbi:MAG: hypothetical protein FWH38_06855 [Treponema sp.]|nr:hypothetical protein [Treponema sp.]
MRSLFLFFSLLYLAIFPLYPQTGPAPRSFNDIFPDIASSAREKIFSEYGYSKSSEKNSVQNVLAAKSTLDPRIVNSVFTKQPGFLVEAVLVVPGRAGEYSLLDVYNALSKVRGLKGRLYHSFTRDQNIPLFEDVTRIESSKRNVPVADPAPVSVIPSSEVIHMRLKDVNFGNSFYRGDMKLEQRGLLYSLTNSKNLSYLFIPVIKEEKFLAQLYFEPVLEGVLIYALAGADVSDFVSSRIDMTSAISKRLAVIISWVADGITGKQRQALARPLDRAAAF